MEIKVYCRVQWILFLKHIVFRKPCLALPDMDRGTSMMPVQIRFNKDCTAIQISAAGSADSVTFPKNGRKTVPNAAKILRENRIQYLETMEEAQKKSKEPHPTGHTGMAGVGSKQLPESLLAYGKEWSCTASNLNRKTRTGRILQHP